MSLRNADARQRQVGTREIEIEQRDGGYVLTDLGSTNGTLVNDQPVTTYRLQLGDRITIGETVLEVRGG